jgi:heme exporter protein C
LSSSTRLALLVLSTTLAILSLLVFSLLYTPVAQAAAGGLAQKIFYFHVPSAYAMYLAGTVCMVGSALYLLRPSEARNAVGRAGAEVAVTFGFLVLTSGPLWAKQAWGVYWTWDPRLTTSLLMVLIYAAVAILHNVGGEQAAERRFAAAIGVLGWFNLPLIHFSVRKWGGTHPTVIGQGGGGLADPRMVVALALGFLALTLLCALLVWVNARTLLQAARLQRVLEHAELDGIPERG